jgi:hypothetical protein
MYSTNTSQLQADSPSILYSTNQNSWIYLTCCLTQSDVLSSPVTLAVILRNKVKSCCFFCCSKCLLFWFETILILKNRPLIYFLMQISEWHLSSTMCICTKCSEDYIKSYLNTIFVFLTKYAWLTDSYILVLCKRIQYAILLYCIYCISWWLNKTCSLKYVNNLFIIKCSKNLYLLRISLSTSTGKHCHCHGKKSSAIFPQKIWDNG